MEGNKRIHAPTCSVLEWHNSEACSFQFLDVPGLAGFSPNCQQHNNYFLNSSFFGCFPFYISISYFPTIAPGITSKMNFLLSNPCFWIYSVTNVGNENKLLYMKSENVTGSIIGDTTKFKVRRT